MDVESQKQDEDTVTDLCSRLGKLVGSKLSKNVPCIGFWVILVGVVWGITALWIQTTNQAISGPVRYSWGTETEWAVNTTSVEAVQVYYPEIWPVVYEEKACHGQALWSNCSFTGQSCINYLTKRTTFPDMLFYNEENAQEYARAHADAHTNDKEHSWCTLDSFGPWLSSAIATTLAGIVLEIVWVHELLE